MANGGLGAAASRGFFTFPSVSDLLEMTRLTTTKSEDTFDFDSARELAGGNVYGS
jgi:hypothetical protein